MWLKSIISSRCEFADFPIRSAIACILYFFLCAQETGCSPVADSVVESARISDANATTVAATIIQPDAAANVEVVSAPIEKDKSPEVPAGNGSMASNVRLSQPVPVIKFRCHECRIIDKDDQHCTNTTECENVDKCHYIHGDVKITNEKSAKVTIAGCGHAPHTEIALHGHDLALDIVHHPFDSCLLVNGTAKKILKPNDIGNTTAVFEGYTCTCNSTICNTHKSLFAAGETDAVKTAQTKGKSSSPRIAAVGANVAAVMALAYLLTFTNNIWKTV